MTDNFDKFIERVLAHEGGYVNNPRDPGGETQWGISKRSYPNVDIKRLTRDQAKEIYRLDFWLAAGCDRMPPLVGFQLLDGAVNSGISRATQWLQRAAGVTADGKIGPKTLGAVQAADPNDLCYLFNAERLGFMTDLKTWDTFGRGWARRIVENLRWAAKDN